MGSPRLDPDQTREEVLAALRSAAVAAWGEDALPEMEPTLQSTAAALWLVGQEPLEPTDLEP